MADVKLRRLRSGTMLGRDDEAEKAKIGHDDEAEKAGRDAKIGHDDEAEKAKIGHDDEADAKKAKIGNDDEAEMAKIGHDDEAESGAEKAKIGRDDEARGRDDEAESRAEKAKIGDDDEAKAAKANCEFLAKHYAEVRKTLKEMDKFRIDNISDDGVDVMAVRRVHAAPEPFGPEWVSESDGSCSHYGLLRYNSKWDKPHGEDDDSQF